MHGVQVIRAALDDVHVELRGALADLDPEILFWQPGPDVNHAGFILWHLVRDEDSVVSHTSRQTEIWNDGGWAARLKIETVEATLPAHAASDLRYNLPGFLEYAEAVWSSSVQRLGALSDDDLDSPAWPGWTVARHLVEGCIGHSWLHLGEIRYLLGLRGWRSRE